MAKAAFLKSFRLKNFKAIRDSGVVKFGPLTVLIGNNGTGKSSLVEGLQTYQHIVADGLDDAMQRWRGIEHIVNPPLENGHSAKGSPKEISPIHFEFSGLASPQFPIEAKASHYKTIMKINKEPTTDLMFIEKESIYYGRRRVLERDSEGVIQFVNKKMAFGIRPGDAIISRGGLYYYADELEGDERLDDLMGYGIRFDWQFLTLNPWIMGEPQPIQRTGQMVRLNGDGSNIAEFLHQMLQVYPDTFHNIIETLQFVLPYMRDLKPVLTDFLGYQMHLEMTEEDFKVKGWLLSTGTLRILALLALFRHPEPPPLIIIEEIENGLDPRTVHLIVEEIRRVTEGGRSQVILTSHSPYLLDLFDLSHVVFVERINGVSTFSRPEGKKELEGWSRRFGPGRLYASGRLRSRELA